ncbi:phage terminase small subunit P27 family [bacterium LRH843]|nr:phage terminase small subunit P27 family [bacterium LRH843]
MSGRKKQPLSVIQGKGCSKHITKDEMKMRQQHEDKMRGSTDKVEAPSYLTALQKKEFDQIAAELMELDIFSNLDVDALARYIDTKTEYEKVTKALRKIKDPTEDIKLYSELRINRNTYFTECRASAADLGLTISSRLKLVIPQQENEKPKSEAERRFGGRL